METRALCRGLLPPSLLTVSAKLGEAIGGIGPGDSSKHVFDARSSKSLRNLVVNLELPGVDDSHVKAGMDRMIEERGVHRLANGVVASV